MSATAIRRTLAASITAALLTLAAIASTAGASTADAGLAGLELAQVQQANCRVLLAGATSSGQRNRANSCIADQQVIIDRLTAASSSPSSSPSATATPSISPPPVVSPTPSMSPSPSNPPTPSPTVTQPSPSPSPTGPLTDCIALPSRCGFPDATNTGARGALTVVQGNVALRTAGEVYADKDVRGCIVVQAPGVVIRNVKVTCGGSYVIDYFPSSGTGVLSIEDTTVVCTNNRAVGIGEWQLVVRRVDVSGCENGFDLDRDALIEDSYCHNLTDEAVVGDAHTDCVQGIQTDDITIRHNTLIVPRIATSAIEGDCATCSGIVRVRWSVVGNLMDGGGYTLYCTIRSTETGSVVADNRFGSNQWTGTGGYATGCNDAGVTWLRNVRDATGALLAAA